MASIYTIENDVNILANKFKDITLNNTNIVYKKPYRLPPNDDKNNSYNGIAKNFLFD